MTKLKFTALFFVFVLALITRGQECNNFSFNFTIDNGLPSNHGYYALKDRFGYLWVCTNNGIVKYNGYDFKTFNLSNGLANADVWHLVEDKKGKIWLGCISDEIGYLYNDEYHKPFLKDINTTIYPAPLIQFENGIAFVSSYITTSKERVLCIEHNDTIQQYENLSRLFPASKSGKYTWFPFSFPGEDNSLIILKDGNAYNYKIRSRELKKICALKDTSFLVTLTRAYGFRVGKYLVAANLDIQSSHFSVLDLSSGVQRDIDVSKIGEGNLQHMFSGTGGCSDHFFLITRDNILDFKVGDSIKFLSSKPIKDMIFGKGVEGSKIAHTIDDSFWGDVIITNSNGLFLKYKAENKFIKDETISLKNFTYLEGRNSKGGFWWNKENQTLAVSDSIFRFTYRKFGDLKHLNSIAFINSDSSLILGDYNGIFSSKLNSLVTKNIFGDGLLQAVIEGKDTLVAISFHGLVKIFYDSNNSLQIQKIDGDRYRHLIVDSIRNSYWAYSDGKIYVHTKTKDSVFNKDKLLKFGIKKLNKIIFDNKYGNVFFQGSIKGEYKITMFDVKSDKYTELFKNFNLTNSLIFMYNDVLIVAGRFGLIFSKISGLNTMSNPVLYKNIKDFNYKYVYDLEVCNNKILLNTDNGVFRVTMPENDTYTFTSPAPVNAFTDYRFLFKSQGEVRNLKAGDTVFINPDNPKLQFDIINASGNGKVKYSYRINKGGIVEMNDNELHIPHLKPDEYYAVTLTAADNVWRSDDLNFYLYVQPKWWQTQKVVKLIWFCVILGAMLLVTISILITRKILQRSHQKRNLQRELELRSIYAQINPHFIFNTLNSAMLLASENRMAEVYTHISKFSRLLRSYIKSSRNRFISLDEEINNLKNYIELQQTRFKDRFSYEITCSDTTGLNEMKVPSLLIQPFVENAINHGLLPKQDNGNLIIKFDFQKAENTLICIVEDNGIGRIEAAKEKKYGTDESYGNLMIKDLVRIFREYENMKIDIQYTDKQNPFNGTIVCIRIKYPKNDK